MKSAKRNAVIYRHGLNKMSVDKNAGKQGLVPCPNCNIHSRVFPDGMLRKHTMNGKMVSKGGIPCFNRTPRFVDVVPVLNSMGIGQRRIADMFGVTRYQVRVVLEKT